MKSKHFKIHELVPRKMYEKYGEKAWRYVDPGLIEAIDILKEEFSEGTITINNYAFGGSREWSGLRTPDCDVYSYGSMHSFGKAFDMVFSKYSSNAVRDYIIKNKDKFPAIKGIELGVSWVHIDSRNENDLIMFSA